MSALFAALMAVVAVYSGSRIVVPALRDAEHHTAVEAWHVAMGACMALMLVVPLPGGLSRAALAVFAVGAGWCVLQAGRHPAKGRYLRLGACCAAMSVMLAPPAVAAASVAGHAHAMHGMSTMPAATAPTLLAATLMVALVAMVGVAAVGAGRLAVSGQAAAAYRFGTAGEIATAAAMAYMLALML